MADALSGIRILDDLMRALAGEHLNALPPLPPLEEMLAGSASNPPFARHGASRADISSAYEQVAQASDTLTANISILEWDPKEPAPLIPSSPPNPPPLHLAFRPA